MLLDISLEFTRVALIAFIILGTIGNVLNIFIFTRRALVRSTCTLYLLANSIDNILVIYTSLLTRLLASGYSYDVTLISNFTCKLRYYVGYIFFSVSPYFYTLACFDRYCSSSTSATRRSWNNKKVAKRLILGAILLACILYLHMAIFFQITIFGTYSSCYSRPGAYATFYAIFYLVIYCMFPSVSMGILCILTLINIRQQSKRIRPVLATGNQGLRRIDRQMIRMLFSQVSTQLLCVLPFAILSLIGLFINTTTTIYKFFDQIFIVLLFVSYTTSFYVFTLSSRTYRQELVKIIWFWKPRQNEQELTMGTAGTGTTARYDRKKATVNLQEE